MNIAVLVCFAGTFESVLPKVNRNLSYVLLLVALMVGIYLGYFTRAESAQNTATQMVTEMIAEELKNDSIACRSVSITKETSPGVYTALAHLSNGKSIEIRIEEKNGLVRVRFDPALLKGRPGNQKNRNSSQYGRKPELPKAPHAIQGNWYRTDMPCQVLDVL